MSPARTPLLLAIALILAAAGQAPAQVDRRPAAAGRVVRVFDFEERHLHDAPVPLHWHRAQHDPPRRTRPGFPIWNESTLDYEISASGEGSVRLDTAGGSTSLRLHAGEIPVLPGGRYRITARARTEGLTFAAAVMTVRFLDGDTAPLGPAAQSRPLRSAAAWEQLVIEAPEAPPNAAYLRIDLELLQEDQLAELRGEPNTAVRPLPAQDRDGRAWFDDVTILLMPRVWIEPAGVELFATGDEPPEMKLHVRDLVGQRLTAQVRTTDHDGSAVWEDTLELRRGAAAPILRPTLPARGFYRSEITVSGDDLSLVHRRRGLLWTAPGRAGAMPDNAGIFASRADDTADAAAFAHAAGFDRLVVAALPDEVTPETIAHHVALLDGLLQPMLTDGATLALCIDRLPRETARRHALEQDRPLEVLAEDPRVLGPVLDPLMERFGQSVRRWMIGRLGDDWLMRDPALGPKVAAARKELSRLVPAPIVLLPWRIDQPPPPSLLAEAGGDLELITVVPGGAEEHAIEAFAAALAAVGESIRPRITLVLEPLERGSASDAARATELSRLAVLALATFEAAGLPRPDLAVCDPWTRSQDGSLSPELPLGVLAGLAPHLSGRRAAMLETPRNVRAILLEPASTGEGSIGEGALVAWADAPGQSLSLLLAGGDLIATDLWGNGSPVPLAVEDGFGRHHLPLGVAPRIVEGVEAPLVRLQQSVRLDPPLVETSGERVHHDLAIDNAWPLGIDVRTAIISPGGIDASGRRDRSWTVSPRVSHLTIPSGERGTAPLEISLSPYQPAGPADLRVGVELRGRDDLPLVLVPVAAEVGLEGLRMDLSVEERSSDRLVVEVVVQNTGDSPARLELTAYAEGRVRQRSGIPELQPGAETRRRLVFTGGDVGEVFVSVLDERDGGRLNRSIDAARAVVSAGEDR